MKLKRICILGTSGSGKTHLSKILSESLKIKNYDSDDAMFVVRFSKTRTPPQRKKYNDILRTLKVCPSGKSPSASAVSIE
jgi:adenylate kinase family enzyme